MNKRRSESFMTQQNTIFDITIIGGGPVGLFTAFYAGMRQMSVKIIESLPQLGGQLSALYPEKFIYDIAGFPKVRAQELIDNLQKRMEQSSPEICLNQSVEPIEKQPDGIFKLTTNSQQHFTKTIIITAGNGVFQPTKLPILSKREKEPTNVHYFIKDLNQFKDRRVVVFGGGDSAVDWSLMLEIIAKEVTIDERIDAFHALE